MADLSVSEVSICNMALSKIGASSNIESLTESSAEAKECNLWYTFSRRQALASNNWSFARRRLTLATHGDDPPDGVWGYRYQYPSDCLQFRKIESPVSGTGAWSPEEKRLVADADAIPFSIELDDNQDSKSILTNLDNAIGVYTMDLTEVTLFSEFFVTTLATAIAVNIAYALTKKSKLEDKMAQRFQQLVVAAQAVDGNEQMEPPPREVSWHRGR
jgi:hypothetical protein